MLNADGVHVVPVPKAVRISVLPRVFRGTPFGRGICGSRLGTRCPRIAGACYVVAVTTAF